MTLLLSAGDLARLLDMGQVIDGVEAAFVAYSSGRTVTPLRVGVEPPGQDGVLLVMPCVVTEPPAMGTKMVSVFRGNPAKGLPTITSLYVLSEFSTGQPLAVMDGTYLTGARTAAGSAVATRHLARPNARTLGVFGTGVQARFHVEAIRRVRSIEQVRVAATSPEKAAAFCQWIQQTSGLSAEPGTAEDAAACDVVAVCTTSRTPVVPDTSVRPGTHLNAVGAFTPTTRELPAALVGRSRVYMDTRHGVESEAGDVLLAVQDGAYSLDKLVGEVGEVAQGRVPGRGSADEVTVYKSVGAAFLDAATARLAVERARAEGIGTEFQFT